MQLGDGSSGRAPGGASAGRVSGGASSGRVSGGASAGRVSASSVAASKDAVALALVKHLRADGHSAVRGYRDASHLPGFVNRNRATNVSDDLAICFPWAASEASQLVEIDPGAVFGAGSHPSTVLAARSLVEHLPTASGPASTGPARVLDVGCGSGVLALVAARCLMDAAKGSLAGSSPIVGIDLDPVAVAQAKRNAAINGLEQVVSFSTTAVGDLGRASEPGKNEPATYDLVVANIGASTLHELAPAIADRLAPGASLILSGISAAQTSRLIKRYAELGVTFELPRRLDDWCALVGKKPNNPYYSACSARTTRRTTN